MSNELLIKEKELRRLNKEVEIKTRHVLEEINFITSRQVNDNSLSKQENENDTLKEASSTFLRQTSEKLPYKNGKSLKKDDAPCEGNGSENKTLVNFLTSKIDILHKELTAIQAECKSKDNYCEKLESKNKELDSCKLKLSNQLGSLKETVARFENNNADLQGRNQSLHTENSNLRKNVEELKREIQTLNHQLNNYDLRLNRSLEENEKLKNTIKFDRLEEKELRDQIRKLKEDKQQAIKHLEKQCSELQRAFKKQLLLIDNLKKQNAFLIAFERMKLTEEDFSELLSWKPSDS